MAERRGSLHERVCISVPVAVCLLSLTAHLSVRLSVHLNAFCWSLGSCLWLGLWNRVLPSICSGETPGCLYSYPAKFLDVLHQSPSGLGWLGDRLQMSQADIAFCILVGRTGWEQNGFPVLSQLGVIWEPCVSFLFHSNPPGPRLTLLWFLA